MLDVLSATSPIFLVVAIGYVLTRVGMFTREHMAILNQYVVRLGLPVLVFVNVHGRGASAITQPTYLLTYALAALAMIALAHVWTALRRGPAVRGAYLGMAMGGTNNGVVGFAIMLIAIPEVAGAAVGMDMVIDNLLIIPLTLFLAERASRAGDAVGVSAVRILGRSLLSALTHPMVVAIILALALDALGLTLPAFAERTVGIVAQSAPGVALFAIGGMLTGLRLAGRIPDIAAALVGKLLVMPALAWGILAGLEAAGLPPLDTALKAAAIITAALPSFSITPALASRHGEGDWAAVATLGGTVLSFVTITAWMTALTAVGWL